ncbi:ABC transporter ATP-binding protein [Bdellovibrionota bacterium FG-2]
MSRISQFSQTLARLGQESFLLREYLWKYRKLVGWGLVTLFIVDILEILPPFFMKQAVDVATGNEPLSVLGYAVAGYFGVAILQGFCRYGWRVFLIRSAILTGRDLRNRFSSHLLGLSASFFDRKPIGEMMSLATSDVEAVRMAVGSGVLVFADAVFYFLTVPVAMWFLSPRLTLIALLPLPIVPWIIFRNEHEMHHRFERVQDAFGKLSSMAQEGLSGIRVVKAFAKEDVQNRRFDEAGQAYVRLNMELAWVRNRFSPTLDFTMSIGLVLLLFIGGRALIFEGSSNIGAALTLGTFVAFQRYIQKMVWPMAALGMAITIFQRAGTSSLRLKEILDEQTDVPHPVGPRLPGGLTVPAPRGYRTMGRVELTHLSFTYPGSEKPVLRDISLTIEAGERVAFVGRVGSGKSALLSLLPRLYPVGAGMISVDGVDINEWPMGELRRQVGYVSQDVFLFSDTVTENLSLGLELPESAALQEALDVSAVHEEILALRESFSTVLGERGVNLSGGQKQRLTIARALAKHPPILVLDDALSSVDTQTEEKILSALRARPGRNTELIAAHRISTIQDADRIVVLEEGGIVQLGRHRDLLLDTQGIYYHFYEQQRVREELERYADSLPDLGGKL